MHKIQNEHKISLAKDLDLKDRQEIYEHYLRYCLTGDVVQLGLGSTVVLERDEKEFMILRSLGDILGLSKFEVIGVHQRIAEQGFKMKAQQIANDGQWTKENIAHLKEIQKQLGLPDLTARKIIEGVESRNTRETIRDLEAKGELKIEQILEMSGKAVDAASLISESSKIQMLRRDAEKAMTDGTGTFHKDEFVMKYSDTLKLDKTNVINIIERIAKERMQNTFVYAISLYRQKRSSEMLKAVQDLVSQYRAFSQPLTWDRKDEIEQMYVTYVTLSHDEELSRAAALPLGLTDSRARALRETISSQATLMSNENEPAKDEFEYFG